MIAGNQAQQGRFTGTVGADNLPVLAGIHRPAKLVEDRPIVIRHDAVIEHNTRFILRQAMTRRRGIRFGQGNAIQFFTVRQLGNQGLVQQVRFFAYGRQGAIREDAGVLHKVGDFIKTVQDQHQGVTLLIERG